MKYQIIGRREINVQTSVEGEEESLTHKIIFTLVEYDFDGTKIVIEVSHYNPFDEEYVIKGIENRAVTEQKNLDLLN